MSDAITEYGDLEVYESEMQTGMFEGLAENLNVFNNYSLGTINVNTGNHTGHYTKKAFNAQVSDLITRKDHTSVAAVDSIQFTQSQTVGVRLQRKIGPLQFAPGDLKLAGLTSAQTFQTLGKQIAEAELKFMIDDAIKSVATAIRGDSTMVVNHGESESGTEDLDYALVQAGTALFTDMYTDLRAMVTHGVTWHELAADALATYTTLDTVGGATLINGPIPGALGLKGIVRDSAGLRASVSSGYNYYTLFLLPGAVTVQKNAPTELWIEKVTGLEKLVYELQGELDYTIEVKGYAWDTVNGGINPTSSSLITTTNWDKAVTDSKNGPGCAVISTTGTS